MGFPSGISGAAAGEAGEGAGKVQSCSLRSESSSLTLVRRELEAGATAPDEKPTGPAVSDVEPAKALAESGKVKESQLSSTPDVPVQDADQKVPSA